MLEALCQWDVANCEILERFRNSQVDRLCKNKAVEFGIAEPSWIERPLDRGTYKVLSDGYQIILDKKHYFENLTPEPSPSCR